jgi:hypothetical protein
MQRIEKWLHQFRSTLYVIWNSYKIETYTIPVPSVMANYVVSQKMFRIPKHVSTLFLLMQPTKLSSEVGPLSW